MTDKGIEQNDIAALTRTARATFAVRCAQRITPLLKYCWPDIPDTEYQQLTESLAAAASAVSSGKLLPRNSSYELGSIKMKALGLAEANRELPEEAQNRISASFVVISSIQHAVGAAEDNLFPDGEIPSAYNAYQSSAVASEAISNDAQIACLTACRQDLEQLSSTGSNNVGPDSLGTLWPNDPPAGWPE